MTDLNSNDADVRANARLLIAEAEAFLRQLDLVLSECTSDE